MTREAAEADDMYVFVSFAFANAALRCGALIIFVVNLSPARFVLATAREHATPHTLTLVRELERP